MDELSEFLGPRGASSSRSLARTTDENAPIALPESVAKALASTRTSLNMNQLCAEYGVSVEDIAASAEKPRMIDMNSPASAVTPPPQRPPPASINELLVSSEANRLRNPLTRVDAAAATVRSEYDPTEPGDSGVGVGASSPYRAASPVSSSPPRVSSTSVASSRSRYVVNPRMSTREPDYATLQSPHSLRDWSRSASEFSTAHLGGAKLPAHMRLDGASVGAQASSRWDRTTTLIDDAAFEETPASDPSLHVQGEAHSNAADDLSDFLRKVKPLPRAAPAPTQQVAAAASGPSSGASSRQPPQAKPAPGATAATGAAASAANTSSSAIPPASVMRDPRQLQEFMYEMFVRECKERGVELPPESKVIQRELVHATRHAPLGGNNAIWDPFHSLGWWRYTRDVDYVVMKTGAKMIGMKPKTDIPLFEDSFGNKTFGSYLVHPLRMFIVDYLTEKGLTKDDPVTHTIDNWVMQNLQDPFTFERRLMDKFGPPRKVVPLSARYTAVYPAESGIEFKPLAFTPESDDAPAEDVAADDGTEKKKKKDKDKGKKDKTDKKDKGDKKEKKDKGDKKEKKDKSDKKDKKDKDKSEKKEKKDKGDKKEKKDKGDKKTKE